MDPISIELKKRSLEERIAWITCQYRTGVIKDMCFIDTQILAVVLEQECKVAQEIFDKIEELCAPGDCMDENELLIYSQLKEKYHVT